MFGRRKESKSYEKALQACDLAIDKLKCVNRVLDQDPQIVIPLRSERRKTSSAVVLDMAALGIKV